MIERQREIGTIRELLHRHPVVGIIGARQVGKTTLARSLVAQNRGPSSYFDLESPEDLARLSDPTIALKKGLRVRSCNITIQKDMGSNLYPLQLVNFLEKNITILKIA
jgi:predicted AAA+ superfamily ATPase